MNNIYTLPWVIEQMTGYKPKTTFWKDFGIADVFGQNAVKETYERAFKEWKNDTEYITELVMVLNWRSWLFADVYEKTGKEEHRERSILYADLYHRADNWCLKNLKKEDLSYYLRTTD